MKILNLNRNSLYGSVGIIFQDGNYLFDEGGDHLELLQKSELGKQILEKIQSIPEYGFNRTASSYNMPFQNIMLKEFNAICFRLIQGNLQQQIDIGLNYNKQNITTPQINTILMLLHKVGLAGRGFTYVIYTNQLHGIKSRSIGTLISYLKFPIKESVSKFNRYINKYKKLLTI